MSKCCPPIFHPRNLMLRTKQKRLSFRIFILKRDRNTCMCKEPIDEFCTAKRNESHLFFIYTVDRNLRP